jgi:hypothetical protein
VDAHNVVPVWEASPKLEVSRGEGCLGPQFFVVVLYIYIYIYVYICVCVYSTLLNELNRIELKLRVRTGLP